jgi:hypothetical protein
MVGVETVAKLTDTRTRELCVTHPAHTSLSKPCERREIIYCKRAILSLLSSKILTPHPPLRPVSVSSPGQYFGRRER